MQIKKIIISLIGFCLVILSGWAWISQSIIPSTQFTAENLGIIVNEADPLSVQIGDYYQRQRSVPEANVIKISFPPQQVELTAEKFKALKAIVDQKTPSRVEGYVLTWTVPYRVSCMSITSAFAFGFNPSFCADGCGETAVNPYFNQKTIHPYRDFKVRPTMMLAATTFAQAKQLIDRGVNSDNTFPKGTGYLMDTTDADRNVRSQFYKSIQTLLNHRFSIDVVKGNTLENKTDVMFYFTGLANVDKLDTLQFRPGAIADHLTSWGGQLIDSSQMSSLRWLEAGATGSYGTVVEPCNYLQKFPYPGIVIENYLNGNTLLESYWRSVPWPGQGVFIGEPLARPFGLTLWQGL
ncbi:MAG: TIGR03790 family protein [Aphanocapsa sp. GSE-SYN-MK-11-07L]|nr:TIGR03790 family protein [Aphanocapsa sp. GSE-SYN-MK-11-07L]